MNADIVQYLNSGDAPSLKPALSAAIAALPAKLQTLPAAQWVQTIQALPGKGQVRAAELEDSKLIDWLKGQGAARLTRQEVLDRLKATLVTVKEVHLHQPQYASWGHTQHFRGAMYQELLYQACSEKMVVEDSLEEIEWEIEQFNFDFTALSENPERLVELEARRKKFYEVLPTAHEYHAPHFSKVDQFGERYGKNLFAHARVVIAPEEGLFLIDEVQSDWAQNGRGREWKGIPQGAFVTETKSWAGLVLRRLLQRAAATPGVRRIAWIRSGLQNGGLSVKPGANHDDFYMKILRGIADAAIKPHGGKVEVRSLQIGQHLIPDLCQIEMTEQLRQGLAQSQPLYSRAQLLPRMRVNIEHERSNWEHLAAAARMMLGSRVHLQLLDRVYDIASGRQVAGRMTNQRIMVSLLAADKDFVLNHECWHYAHEYLLTSSERRMVEAEFAPGTELNERVRHLLRLRGDLEAAQQCKEAKEAAAHGFALFVQGHLDVRRPEVKSLFAQVWQAFKDIGAWLRSTNQQRLEATDVYALFEGVRRGDYSPDAQTQTQTQTQAQDQEQEQEQEAQEPMEAAPSA